MDQKLTWDDFLKKAEAGAKTTTTYNITIPKGDTKSTKTAEKITAYTDVFDSIAGIKNNMRIISMIPQSQNQEEKPKANRFNRIIHEKMHWQNESTKKKTK